MADLEGVPREPWTLLWLDQVLTSIDDRLTEALLPGWRKKKTTSVTCLSMPEPKS